MLVDSHCHLPLLNLESLGGSLEAVLDTAVQHGVERMLCVSVELSSFPQIRTLAHQNERVFASVGVHPNTDADPEPTVERLCALAADDRVIAIGETGLDYFRCTVDPERQRQRFRTHIAAAKRAGKPLIVHTREARTDVINILEEEGAHEVGGVMHCFVYDYETATKAMNLNFLISFSGIVTFKNATEVQDVAKKIPLDRLLVETDAPYLAPTPFRGKENQPAYVRHVADYLAGLKGVAVMRLEDVTTENFNKLFLGRE